MRVIELNKKMKNTKSKAEVDAMIKKMKAEDEKLVKGQFEFVEAEGGFFEFSYRMYPGTQIQTFQLIHGEICEIPMGIVKHLNGTKKKIRRYKDVEQEIIKRGYIPHIRYRREEQLFLNFSFFKIDPKWRWLNEIGKEEAAKEFESFFLSYFI